MSKTKLSLAVFSAIIGISPMVATAEETKGEGFVEGSSLNILNRNFYMNRDFRDGQSSSTGSNRSMNPVLADGFFQEAEAEAGEQFHGSSAS